MSVKTLGQIHPFMSVSVSVSKPVCTLDRTLLRDDAYVGECRSEISVLQRGYHAENRIPVKDALMGIVVQRK